jgi:hypothetical protein
VSLAYLEGAGVGEAARGWGRGGLSMRALSCCSTTTAGAQRARLCLQRSRIAAFGRPPDPGPPLRSTPLTSRGSHPWSADRWRSRRRRGRPHWPAAGKEKRWWWWRGGSGTQRLRPACTCEPLVRHCGKRGWPSIQFNTRTREKAAPIVVCGLCARSLEEARVIWLDMRTWERRGGLRQRQAQLWNKVSCRAVQQGKSHLLLAQTVYAASSRLRVQLRVP